MLLLNLPLRVTVNRDNGHIPDDLHTEIVYPLRYMFSRRCPSDHLKKFRICSLRYQRNMTIP
jgi:hypothetical protein